MKIFLVIIVIAVVLAVGGFFFLAQQSKSGGASGLVNGALAPCPSSPNCVCSEAGTPESHAVASLPLTAWEQLPDNVEAQGGEIVTRNDDYIAATFASSLFGFVDDVEFRKAEDAVHVRSASRVGHSDMGANQKRVEALRTALAAASAP